MSEPDPYGEYGFDDNNNPLSQAEAQQQFMLGLHDLAFEAGVCGFSPVLIQRLREVRLEFLNEFEAKFPGYGQGRAIWR